MAESADAEDDDGGSARQRERERRLRGTSPPARSAMIARSSSRGRDSGVRCDETAAEAGNTRGAENGGSATTVNGAVARYRPVGCAISTKSRRCDGAIVEIVVNRVGPMASESRLLFICDMSSYPDAVDISQLNVRWGHLSGP
ncbi:hypothetical protein Scep_004650 [Stephania cephalantha]|uniref:Uncharacterized protein n=1 Tax=Stephania cephalantha TaxID=152367 RepID=A0AAP0KSU6_9MAGN